MMDLFMEKLKILIEFLKSLFPALLRRVKNLNLKTGITSMKQTQLFADQPRRRGDFLKRRQEYQDRLQAKEMLKNAPEKIEDEPKTFVDFVYKNVKRLSETENYNGMAVIILDKSTPVAFGEAHECTGVVRLSNSHHCEISALGRTYLINTSKLALYDDFLKLEISGVLKPTAKFAIDQIVYVIPNDKLHGPTYPAIGTEYETDLKVTSIYPTNLGSSFGYNVYSPSYGPLTFHESILVSVKDKLKYVYPDYLEVTSVVDLSPFFSENESLMVYDRCLRNKDNSVIVPLTEELKKYIK